MAKDRLSFVLMYFFGGWIFDATSYFIGRPSTIFDGMGDIWELGVRLPINLKTPGAIDIGIEACETDADFGKWAGLWELDDNKFLGPKDGWNIDYWMLASIRGHPMWASFLGKLLANNYYVNADNSGKPILRLVKEYLNKKIRNRAAFLNVFVPRVFAGLALADESGYYIRALELVKRHLCTWRPDAPHAWV